MPSKQFEIGLQCRKDVLGAEYVEASLAKADDFNRDFQASAFVTGQVIYVDGKYGSTM